jgi:hypothetical protein
VKSSGSIAEISGANDSGDSVWSIRFFAMLAAVFVVRIAYIAVFPCDLVGDEAYYWDWGRRLDWGYFSKPPLIAWMMAMADFTGLGTAFGLRMWAAILGCASMVMMFLLGRRMYGTKAGFFAALLFAAAPGTALLSLVLTIDAPLVFFWTCALYLFYRLTLADRRGEKLIIALFLCVVCGLGHLSKQIMWLFPPLCAVYLFLDGEKSRKKLFSPLVVITFAVSYLFLVPTIIWNAHHGWITFLHTSHHFHGNSFSDFPRNLSEFVTMQLGAVSPLTLVLVAGLCVVGLLFWFKLASRERFLIAFGAVPLAMVMCLTVRQRLNGNWAAAFYPAAVILVAGWATAEEPLLYFPRFMRCWLKPAAYLAIAMSAVFYILPFAIDACGLKGTGYDPYGRLRGWSKYAENVQNFRNCDENKNIPIIVVGHRYYTSELAFYLPDQPRVYRWAAKGVVESQYEMWGGLEKLAGGRVLVVSTDTGGGLPSDLSAKMDDAKRLGVASVDTGNGRMINAVVYCGIFNGDGNAAGN